MIFHNYIAKKSKNNKTLITFSFQFQNVNLILETNAANLELCSIQTSHNCTSNLLRNEIDNLDNENLIISIELLDEFTR